MTRNRTSRVHGRRGFAVVGLATLVLTVLAAWGGSAGATPSGSVQPFSKVQASRLVFVRDTSDPSRGIFRVTTKVPMICAIVWGTTDSFGRFNNSLAMNGTGIKAHNVLLPDAKPGVKYRYVIQGTTADGTLYRSKVSTFSIPAAKPVAPDANHGPDLALHAKIAAVSSQFSKSFAATNAVDGRTSTEWATDGDGNGGFITIDLGAPRPIGGVEFLTRSMGDGSAITDSYTVTVDGGAPLGPFKAGTVAGPLFTPLAVTGQQIRFGIAKSTGGNVGAVELRVFGPQSRAIR